jgi:hypothetical protein
MVGQIIHTIQTVQAVSSPVETKGSRSTLRAVLEPAPELRKMNSQGKCMVENSLKIATH